MTDQCPTLHYVVLRHEGIADPHFDLMFESEPGGTLTTWRSPIWPLEDEIELLALGAHRRAYLDYEGPISHGRGTVRRVESGRCAVLVHTAERFSVTCEGGRELELRRVSGDRWRAVVNQM